MLARKTATSQVANIWRIRVNNALPPDSVSTFRRVRRLRTTIEDLVDQTERLGLFSFQERVAIHGGLDLVERLTGKLDVEIVEAATNPQDFLGLNLDIARHALG